MEHLKRSAEYECMCVFCPPASLSASESKQQAGRSQGFHNHVRNPRDFVMKPPRNGRAKAWYSYILE
jgi:hypothetical protein